MLIPKVLVVCDSRTRATERVAYAIQNCLQIRGLRCDVELLHDPASARSAKHTAEPSCCATAPLRHKTEEYDIVVVGAPASGPAVSSQVETFLHAHGAEIHGLGSFVVRGGHYEDGMSVRIEELAGRPPIAQLAVPESAIENGKFKKLVRPFVEQLEHEARRRAQGSPAAPQSPSTQ